MTGGYQAAYGFFASRSGRYYARAAALLVLYIATARLGLSLGAVDGVAAAVWPPAGIALAALLLWGADLWPAVWCGAWLANVAVGVPWLVAASIAVGNTLEAVCGFYLLRRCRFDEELQTVRDVILLVLVAVSSTVVSATIGVTSSWIGGVITPDGYARAWITWWLGDATGDLVVAPVLLTLTQLYRRRAWLQRPGEAAVLLALLALLNVLSLSLFERAPAPYMVFPFLIWAALRLGQPLVACTAFLASAIAVWGTAHALGPFDQGALYVNLLLLQMFMSVVVGTGLISGALIAEQQRTEAALRASEARFRRIADSGILAIGFGNAGKLTDANQAFLSLLGCTRSDLPLDMRLLTPPEYRAVSDRAEREISATGTCAPFEKEYFRKDGSRVRVLMGAATLGSPDGGAVAFALDLTDRQRAAEARAHLAAIVESSHDAIIGRTLDGTITSWNAGAEHLYGFSAAEVIGNSISIIIPADRPEELPVIIERIQRGERIEHYESRRLRKSGEIVDVSIRISPVHDQEGTLAGLSVVARDITQQKRAEEALREADRRKDEFLAILGHELRNPLAPIRNALHLLRNAAAGEVDSAWALGLMDRQVQHLTRLVDDLLQVGRITSGQIQLQKERVALASLINAAVEASRPLIDASRHELTIHLPAAPLWVDVDTTRMAQVIGNLLNNAARYTEPGGHIWLEVDSADQHVSIRVRDNGIGLAPEMMSKVFDLFSQADRSLARSQGGLGVGLAIVKRLVQMHGGEVAVTSAGPGKGSEFVVQLPLAPHPPAPSVAPAKSPVANPALRILVVDDNIDGAETLSTVLRLAGHVVQMTHDGPSTIELARAFEPEVVLLDIGLPGFDGYEVARRLRQANLRDTFIVAVTGYGQEEERRRSKESGCDHHLVKPVQLEALKELLSSKMRSRRSYEQSANSVEE